MSTLIGISGQAKAGKDTTADYLVSEYGFVKFSLADHIKRFGSIVFDFTEEQLWGPSKYRNKPDRRYTDATDYAWNLAYAQIINARHMSWLLDTLTGLPPGSDLNLGTHNWYLRQWFDTLREQHPKLTPRVMLQTLGTEWGRQKIDNDLWVNHSMRTIKKILNGQKYTQQQGLMDTIVDKPTGVVVPDVRFLNEFLAVEHTDGHLWRIKRPETDSQANTTGISGHSSEMEQQDIADEEFDVILVNDDTYAALYEAVDIAVSTLIK